MVVGEKDWWVESKMCCAGKGIQSKGGCALAVDECQLIWVVVVVVVVTENEKQNPKCKVKLKHLLLVGPRLPGAVPVPVFMVGEGAV